MSYGRSYFPRLHATRSPVPHAFLESSLHQDMETYFPICEPGPIKSRNEAVRLSISLLKGHTTSTLLTGTLAFWSLNHHVRNWIPLRPPCYEDAETSLLRETMRLHEGEWWPDRPTALAPHCSSSSGFLTKTGWETPSRSHPAKPFLDTCPKET